MNAQQSYGPVFGTALADAPARETDIASATASIDREIEQLQQYAQQLHQRLELVCRGEPPAVENKSAALPVRSTHYGQQLDTMRSRLAAVNALLQSILGRLEI